MTDIVERLRATLIPELYVEAADEIERLRSMRECTEEQCPYEAQRAEIERLRAQAEADARRIGDLEFALANIRDSLIDTDPDVYAAKVLRPVEQTGPQKGR